MKVVIKLSLDHIKIHVQLELISVDADSMKKKLNYSETVPKQLTPDSCQHKKSFTAF